MSKEKIDLIYDLMKQDREESADFRKEVRQSHVNHGERLQKIETETTERLAKIEALDEVQNQQLAEHMRRTDILEELHRDNSKRIQMLEEPGKVVKTLKKWLLGLGAVAGAAVAISKFLGLF
jgi:hypothetical protein